MDIDLGDLTNEQIEDLLAELEQEAAERRSREAIENELRTWLMDTRENTGTPTPAEGAEYVLPKGTGDSYLEGEIVHHDGAYWKSLRNTNVCVPQDEVPPPKGCGNWQRIDWDPDTGEGGGE